MENEIRLIDANALLQTIKFEHDRIMQDPEVSKNMKWCEAVCNHRVTEAIERSPTVDAVPVVRCKDCKHRGDYGCPMYHEEYIEWEDDGYHESEIVEHDRTRDDGFCDLGERRTDNE